MLLATEKETGKQYACKCIRKKLDVPNISIQHQAAHLDHIKREVAILRRLKGTLNVAPIIGAYEDDTFVYIVLEYCQGGELWLRIGKLHYSERTVCRVPASVLPQCKQTTQCSTASKEVLARQQELTVVIVQAASYMRAVLRTLAQCHARRILHRDVKVPKLANSSSADHAAYCS